MSELHVPKAVTSADSTVEPTNPWLDRVLASRSSEPVAMVAEARRLPRDHQSVKDTVALAAALTAYLASDSDVAATVTPLEPIYRNWWQRFADFSFALRVNVQLGDDNQFEVRVPDLAREGGRASFDALSITTVAEAVGVTNELLQKFPNTKVGALAFDSSLPGFAGRSRSSAYVVVPEGSPELHVSSDFILQTGVSTNGGGSVRDAVTQAFWPEVESLLTGGSAARVAELNADISAALGLPCNVHDWFAEPGTKLNDAQVEARDAIARACPHFADHPCDSRRELLAEVFAAAVNGADDVDPAVVDVLVRRIDQTLGISLR